MKIERVFINNFRILSRILIKPERINFIIGNNGQGKTSIIEAISLLSGSSFRKTPDKEIVKFGEDGYLVQININKNNISNVIQVSYSYNRKKSVVLNDKRSKILDLIREFPLTVCSLQDIGIVHEQRLRKSFFDRMISYIDNVYYNNLIKLVKATKNRNRLLKEKKETLFWDMVISETLPLLIKKRFKIIDGFNNFLKTHNEYFPEGIRDIEFVYNTIINNPDKNTVLKIFEEFKNKDVERGFSTSISFDQYSILVNGKKIRYFASTGQIKLIVSLLFFLQALFVYKERGIKPIILLDDIFSDIDSYNRKKLLSLITENDFQTFITMTLEDFSNLENRFNVIRIDKGCVVENKSV